jgi:thioesterase domain-containing protein
MQDIDKTFGKKLPLARLYQAPTIEQLTKHVGKDVSLMPSSSLLVPLQPSGSKRPFFWIHGENSNFVLPRYLGQEQPLYGIVHQGHDGRPAPYTTVEDMAAHYLEEIRRVQPEGPYYLGGYCFGGVVALEMAQRLKEKAQEVGLLVLLDPDDFIDQQTGKSVTSPSRNPGKQESFGQRVRRRFTVMKGLRLAEAVQYCFNALKSRINDHRLVRKGRAAGKTAAYKVCFRLGWHLPAVFHSHYMLKVYDSAFKRYKPRPYSGRMIIWKTVFSPVGVRTWKKLAREVEIVLIAKEHSQVLQDPHMNVWAERLSRELRDSALRVFMSCVTSTGFQFAVELFEPIGHI